MQTLRSIGNFLLGTVALVGIIVVAVLLFTLGARVALAIQPFVNWLAGILFILNIIVLLFALVPRFRSVSGLIIFISSYIYGLSTWIFGLAVTLTFWGWFAVIIGVLLGGVGVVPIGLLAAGFNGQWGIFWSLLVSLILTIVARMIGMALVSKANNQHAYDEDRTIDTYTDGKVVSEPQKRTWEDIE